MSINLINYALAKKDWKKAYEDLKVLGVGGRNLLRNSAEEHVLDSSDHSLLHLKIVDGLQSGEEYTISFEAKTTNGTDNFYISTVIKEGSSFQKIFDLVPSDHYARYSYTFVAQEGSENVVGIMIVNRVFNNPNNTGSLYIKKLKLEKGNKATDWTPAPEDINAHPFVAELAETVYRSKQNEERIRDLENAITALGGGS